MTAHIPFQPTDEQRANLLRLAAHLDLGVTNLQFDMGTFQNDCGTIGCACGHGPSLGIARRDREDWYAYAERAFGTDATDDTGIGSHAWLFYSFWRGVDNTPRGAAARIYYLLAKGVPADCKAQYEGKAPLSYSVPDRAEGPTVAAKVSA